jgi:hypothetical protein
MNNIYLFLVYSLCAITIIYLIHTVILTELNKYNKDSDNKTGDDNYDDNVEMLSYQLRGLYINSIVERELRTINGVLMSNANNGIHNSGYFTIMCIELIDRPIEKCKSHDGYKEWSFREKQRYGTITVPNINPNIIRNRVIHKLQNVFPDSNITQSHHNCCDYYKISW